MSPLALVLGETAWPMEGLECRGDLGLLGSGLEWLEAAGALDVRRGTRRGVRGGGALGVSARTAGRERRHRPRRGKLQGEAWRGVEAVRLCPRYLGVCPRCPSGEVRRGEGTWPAPPGRGRPRTCRWTLLAYGWHLWSWNQRVILAGMTLTPCPAATVVQGRTSCLPLPRCPPGSSRTSHTARVTPPSLLC